MSEGWVALHRQLQDHWLWKGEVFTKGQAWIDLVLSANHKDARITIKGQIVAVKRGQQARSELTLSKTWGWSRGKVRRFLGTLENDSMIVQQTGHLTSIITICNYNDFQSIGKRDGTTDSTGDGTTDGTTDGHLTVHKQQCNNNNNENNENKKHRGAQESRPGKTKTSLEIPPWLDIELWHEWLKTRKSLKCPNSARALKTQLNKLQALEEKQPGLANIALEEANGSGWKSIYEPKQLIKNSKDDKELDDWLNGNDSIFNSKTEKGNVIEGVFKDA